LFLFDYFHFDFLKAASLISSYTKEDITYKDRFEQIQVNIFIDIFNCFCVRLLQIVLLEMEEILERKQQLNEQLSEKIVELKINVKLQIVLF
jgi:hypothetical protein